MILNGCEVTVQNGSISEEEMAAYVDRGLEKYGKALKGVTITVDGEYVDLDYHYQTQPFHRIRRITGYLVGTLDRFNDGKRAEERDRVKHSIA